MRSTSHRFTTQLFAGAVLAVFVFIGILQIFAVAENAAAAAPATNILGYQGRLLDSNGVPVADATASVIFELYTSGDVCVWSNSSTTCATATARTVTLSDGLFSEALGDTAATPAYSAIGDSIFADNASLYLQVTINGETLSPKKRILSAGYALNSQTLDGYNTTLTGGTSSAVTVLDANGNLQLTGNPQGTGASQGSLYINPAGDVVGADETLFGIAVGGSEVFRVSAEGNVAVGGDLRVSGGDINSTVALNISSTGGNISFGPSGSGIAYVTSGDDFAVGGDSLVAPFSFDESANVFRIGDGADDATSPSIVFYASDATNNGTISYTDDDLFSFTGGNFSHTSLGIFPTTAGGNHVEHLVSTSWTGTSIQNLGDSELITLSGSTQYSGIEHATNTNHLVTATRGSLTLSGATATLTNGYGVSGKLVNGSTNASLLQGFGHLAGVDGTFEQSGAATIASGHGVRGNLYASAGTITDGYGVYGAVLNGGGTVTRGYGGYFLNNSSGATRYGVYGYANGGATANYAGYFGGALVQIDDDNIANTPGTATGAGDLYIVDALEVDGSVVLGDVTGTDTFTFTSAISESNAATFTLDSLTTGNGLVVSRADGAADFSGSLLLLSQNETSATSNGDVVTIQNNGGGDAVGLYIVQAQLSDETNGAGGTTVGAQALVLETSEAGSNDDIMLVRANGQLTLAIESNGRVLSDSTFESSGADYAEYFLTADSTLEMSEVVCHDRANANMVKRCEAANTEVVGIISPTPGFVGGLPASGDGSLKTIVGLTGQIDTLVTAAEGAIAVGDAVTASQTLSGHAALARGPVRIIGYALESLSSGTGTIKIYVNPQWYGGDVLASDGSATLSSTNIVLAPTGTATSSASSFASYDLTLRGSAWNGSEAIAQSMGLSTQIGSADYRLSIANTAGTEVAFITDGGDLAISGRLYPSDRGILQTDKYIFYDGSTGTGGDMMRTNAAGWSSGSYDFAEMFPSKDMLSAGELVVFADGKEQIQRSTGKTYDNKIAGVVSTRPAFLAGENRIGDVPVALAGRVPTYVSSENGIIAIGDPLTSSAKAGYVMKATEPGPIVGYAMESFAGKTGVIITFIRPSYYDGGPIDEAPIAKNLASEISNLGTLDISGSLNMNGGSILSVASLMGIGQQWRIEEDGDFFTRGRIVQIVKSYAGNDVETYASAGREQTIELSGTSSLNRGKVKVEFDKIDPSFNDIIANDLAYRVYLTPAGLTGMLAAIDRTNQGFTIQEAGSSSGIMVDWLVVAYHKDFPPKPLTEIIEVPVIPQDEAEMPAEDPAEIPAEVPAEPGVAPVEKPSAEPATEAPPTASPLKETPPLIVEVPAAEEVDQATEKVAADTVSPPIVETQEEPSASLSEEVPADVSQDEAIIAEEQEQP